MKDKIIEIFSLVMEMEIAEIDLSLQKEEVENWDSIAHLTLVSDLETEFEISFSPEEIEGLESLNDVIGAISAKEKK